MTSQPLFSWSDRFLLGHRTIDETHREFVDCVDALLRASDVEIPAALDAFARHAESHFAQEDKWLAAADFPGGGECHIDEHAKVMASVREVQEQVAGGEVHIARELAQALMDWFPGHADYMDSALATWLVSRMMTRYSPTVSTNATPRRLSRSMSTSSTVGAAVRSCPIRYRASTRRSTGRSKLRRSLLMTR